jgi:hypothetical protein
LVARHDFARALEQSLQDLEGLPCKPLAEASFAHFARGQVYFEDAEPN